jgi:hypothetical protein
MTDRTTVAKAQEVLEDVNRIEERDLDRNLLIGQDLTIVSTDDEGIQVMHTDDYLEGYGTVYKLSLTRVYN